MKIEQAPKKFNPVTITLETPEELKIFTMVFGSIVASEVANAYPEENVSVLGNKIYSFWMSLDKLQKEQK